MQQTEQLVPTFVLITPTYNEQRQIEGTIQSVLNQRHRPLRWIIVDDGSTDRTGEIIERYAAQHQFIEAMRVPVREKRSGFGSKVRAIRAAYARLCTLSFEFVGNLDADVTFDSDYFGRLLVRMRDDPSLGIAGGIVVEERDGYWREQRISLNSVAGAVQMFRREAYDAIGGFLELDLGGVDSAAEIMVRSKGWRTQTFPDLMVRHHGRVTMGGRNQWITQFRKGRVNYTLGYHPLFHLALSCLRMSHRPYVIGGLLMLAGYVYEVFQRKSPQLPPKVVDYLRREQMMRLKAVAVLRENWRGTVPG